MTKKQSAVVVKVKPKKKDDDRSKEIEVSKQTPINESAKKKHVIEPGNLIR